MLLSYIYAILSQDAKVWITLHLIILAYIYAGNDAKVHRFSLDYLQRSVARARARKPVIALAYERHATLKIEAFASVLKAFPISFLPGLPLSLPPQEKNTPQ